MKIAFVIAASSLVACAAGGVAPAHAVGVTYTLFAVSDGSIGGQSFSNTRVTMTFSGDTSDVHTSTTANGTVYTLTKGQATVLITRGFAQTSAHVASGQVYVTYDVSSGVVGFASHAVGPLYPLTLATNCGGTCPFGQLDQFGYEGGLLTAIADIKAYRPNRAFYSPAVSALPATLLQSTLLSGYVQACVAYPYQYYGACLPTPSPGSAIRTDAGDLYFYDQSGGNQRGLFTVELGTSHPD